MITKDFYWPPIFLLEEICNEIILSLRYNLRAEPHLEVDQRCLEQVKKS